MVTLSQTGRVEAVVKYLKTKGGNGQGNLTPQLGIVVDGYVPVDQYKIGWGYIHLKVVTLLPNFSTDAEIVTNLREYAKAGYAVVVLTTIDELDYFLYEYKNYIIDRTSFYSPETFKQYLDRRGEKSFWQDKLALYEE